MPASQETGIADAITLLTQDHRQVEAMFQRYDELVESAAPDGEKEDLASEICLALTVHALVEEELFYPEAREALDEEDLVDEATVEHACAKDLIAQLQRASPADDPLYDAKVKVLGEYVDHHVQEEEGEMFPQLARAAAEMRDLGARIAARQEELLAEIVDQAEAAAE